MVPIIKFIFLVKNKIKKANEANNMKCMYVHTYLNMYTYLLHTY